MTEVAERRKGTRTSLWLILAALALLLVGFFVPSLISISRYKGRITQLVSASLGRPVRLSSVELKLLPRPGFVLTDLTVEEDPAYGVEPVLHATTVTTAIRLSSLWSGHLALSRISVDEASLNLVRTDDGRWNLDSLFRTAAAHAGNPSAGRMPQLPYLEATNSRVNIKRGLEKLPYSLVNADLSFWQENPGEWRLRLRGQPARTDVNLDLADTGIVRLEASLRRAPELRQMPIHVDMEWREAQLGQLSRLLVGSDPGWRGDLTGQMQLDGTAEAAQVKTRLSAAGVHRAEFAPAEPLDFDANCAFVYHYSARSLENLACSSPLGDGQIKMSGDMPSNGPGKLAVQVLRIPVSAGLDVLRTLRNGIGDDVEARGTVSGELTYDPSAARAIPPLALPHRRSAKANAHGAADAPLQGSLTIEGFQLSASALKQPIQIAKIVLQPGPVAQGQPQALATVLSVPAGGATPLTIAVHFARSGYQASIRGLASFERLRELAGVAGIADASLLDGLAGEPVSLDVGAQGPWLSALRSPVTAGPAGEPIPATDPLGPNGDSADQLSGTVTLHNANWKPQPLPNHIQIAQATLHLGGGALLWEPVEFSYGPVKGTGSLKIALACEATEPCPPQLDLHFNDLDAAALQAGLLGAPVQGNGLANLIARFTPASPPVWPRLNATVEADSLVLGPTKFQNASLVMTIRPDGADLDSINASVLGGQIHASGTITNPEKPSYSFDGTIAKAAGPALCQLLGVHCAGGTIDGSGKLTLSGFSDRDLAASASGTLHFDWRHGAVIDAPLQDAPTVLAHFDRWTADAAIAHNTVTLKENQVQQGVHKTTVEASITFGDPPKVRFGIPAPEAQAQK